MKTKLKVPVEMWPNTLVEAMNLILNEVKPEVKVKSESFPVNQLGKTRSILVKDANNSFIEIDYQNLNLVVIGSQLCFKYESAEGDLFMPIARLSTLSKLFRNSENLERVKDDEEK